MKVVQLVAIGTALMALVGCKEPAHDSEQAAAAGLKSCKAQTTMKGQSSTKQYDSEEACVADRKTLQDEADADGKSKCATYCADPDPACKPSPEPKPPKTTHPCKKGDDGKVTAQNLTGDFDCICKK